MENNRIQKMNLIAHSYNQYFRMVINYINRRIDDYDEAMDMAQDVFVRLIEYKDMICKETVRNFIFSIAQNIVIDYIRRKNKKIEIYSYIYDMQSPVTYYTPEEGASVHDLQRMERHYMELLPLQRRKIYYMTRIEEKSADEISMTLHIKKRTVESHQFAARKEIREHLREVI